ncbi:MAG: hypothetical protein RR585_06295 [Coprobacillus sp.]
MLKISSITKKILLVSMSMFLFCLSVSIDVNAQENHQEGDLSQEELSVLDEIYEVDPNFTFEGDLVSVAKKTQIMGTTKEIVPSGDVLGRGAIGNNYMTIYVTTSRVTDGSNDTFNITATATWKLVPAFRMQDGFAIAWGKDFALKSSSTTTSYKSIGVISGKTVQVSMCPNTGIGYSVEASHWYGQALDWVRINAKISQKNRKGTANVSAAYCHRTASIGGVGINFGGTNAAISFDVIGTYDNMSKYTTFNY